MKKIITLYDGKKIVAGLIVFLVIIALPLCFALINRDVIGKPELKIDSDSTQCVESAQFMKEKHMQLLNSWRNLAVREGVSVYTATDGNQYNISLSGTCFQCHNDKQQFCDRCHSYTGTEPNCWDCHTVPEEDN